MRGRGNNEMIEDKKIRINVIYGFVSLNPNSAALIKEFPKLTILEIICYGALDILKYAILPALIFAFIFAFSYVSLLYVARVILI